MSDPLMQQTGEAMLALFSRQRESFLAEGVPDAARRIDRIDRSIALLVDNRKRLCEALASDFGHRSHHQSEVTDIYASIEALKHGRRHLARWMRPERRKVQFPLGLLGARAWVHHQPLGVVGLIVPWNFPLYLTFSPLAGIFAAGNRAMIKPSEVTPATAQLLGELIEAAYDETEVRVVDGSREAGAVFTTLPFDHLLFTGSPATARQVMRAAAENLVPVTLELGGKSPVIVSAQADVELAAKRVMLGKTLNAGQICLAPDYLFVHEEQRDAFVAAARDIVRRMYPDLLHNPDYTAVIDHRQYNRLRSYVDEARSGGVETVEINPASEDFSGGEEHKVPPTLLIEPDDRSRLMQEEIFGPLLPIKTYTDIGAVIEYINRRPRPLALYYFGRRDQEFQRVLRNTTSGGLCLNEVAFHALQEDLPFGGVGNSGMGAYHGHDGFRTFSHGKSVYQQSRFDITALLRPPYGARFEALMARFIKK